MGILIHHPILNKLFKCKSIYKLCLRTHEETICLKRLGHNRKLTWKTVQIYKNCELSDDKLKFMLIISNLQHSELKVSSQYLKKNIFQKKC